MSVEGKSDHREVAQLFVEHFKVSSPLGLSLEVTDAEFYVRGHEPLLHGSAAQVRATVEGMTPGKSLGHDGLNIEHLKYVGNHLSRVLSMFSSIV